MRPATNELMASSNAAIFVYIGPITEVQTFPEFTMSAQLKVTRPDTTFFLINSETVALTLTVIESETEFTNPDIESFNIEFETPAVDAFFQVYLGQDATITDY